jgi:hypothetical protein
MGNPVKYIIYFIFSALSVTTLIYYLANTDLWELYGYNLGFVILVASIFYTVYMFIHEIVKPESPVIVAAEGIEVQNVLIDRNFMEDVYFKYLFCFSFAVLVFYGILTLRENFKNFDIFPSDWYYVADLYVNLILPVYLLCELMMTNRYRHHHYMADILVLFVLCFAHCAYKVLIRSLYYEQYNIALPTIADYIMIYLISLNGYSLYDYLLYKKSNPQGNYALFSA